MAKRWGSFRRWLLLIVVAQILLTPSLASLGDRLPDFRECKEVRAQLRTFLEQEAERNCQVCIDENCSGGKYALREYLRTPCQSRTLTWTAFQLRLMLWTCPQNCDYVCQHIITHKRVSRDPPMLEPVVQYHGKWPFYRFIGMQEPFSVLFSLMNFMAHKWGQEKLQASVPASYPLRKWYVAFGYFGYASWIFSMLFHTRDFNVTEKLDYFAAGASVFYGLYYTPIRVFRLEQGTPVKQSLLRMWTLVCGCLFAAHVSYLTFWRWDYGYNMAANVVAGVVQNLLWSGFSILSYRRLQKTWTAWPGLIVAWIVLAMSLELLDFPPLWGMIDAHSLWHLGTVGPTVWWYK